MYCAFISFSSCDSFGFLALITFFFFFLLWLLFSFDSLESGCFLVVSSYTIRMFCGTVSDADCLSDGSSA